MFGRLNYKEGMYSLMWDIVTDTSINRLYALDEDEDYSRKLNFSIKDMHFGSRIYNANWRIANYREAICRHLEGRGYLKATKQRDGIEYSPTKKAKYFNKETFLLK